MSDHTGVWLYAVVSAGNGELEDRDPEGSGALDRPDSSGSWLPSIAGVDGERVYAVSGSGLTAIVGRVRLDEFGEEALHRNLENLTWLERVARAHDTVIAAVAELVPAVPLRLATVCHDDDRVREVLAEHSAEFTSALQLIDGRSEWGVRAHVRKGETTLVPSGTPRSQRSTGALPRGAGAAYLKRRRSELSARQEADRAAAEEAAAVHETLCRYAVGARRQPPPSPQLAGTDEPVLLNGAYLIDHSRTDDFVAAVNEMNSSTLRLVLTGPWPPYSFTAAVQGVAQGEPRTP